jgi:serine/threonine protein kinase
MGGRLGQQLGHYRLVRLLGRGGFAEVYLGEHVRLGTQAAVKVLSTALEDDDIEGFLREAQMVARLKHPHIVRVFDFDVEDHTPFLVMDYLPNGNVRRSHPKGIALPLETIVSYVKQIASALQYAHDQKLIHRDIKPENMLLDQDNSIVLSDFGIALMAQSSHYQSTQEVAGTAAYMAPEQFQGHPHRASDQYALGIVVYEWLSGDRPFHGTFSEIASQHLFVPPPPLRERVPTISPDVEQVVLTAMAKDPKERFATIQAFATALEHSCQTAPSRPIALPSELPSPSQLLPPTATLVAFSSPQRSGLPNAAPSSPPPEAISATPLAASLSATTSPNDETTPPVLKTWRNAASANRPQGFPMRRIVLLIGLALFVLIGSLGLYYVRGTNQITLDTSSATATTQTNRTVTATPQTNLTATATVATANAAPYPIQGTLALDDPLRQPDNDWDNNSNSSLGGACQFTQEAYHVSQYKPGPLYSCIDPSRDLSNFTFEVQMTIIKGDCGGIQVRYDITKDSDYTFGICQNRFYAFRLFLDPIGPHVEMLTSGSSPAIHAGYNQSNVIAVVANGSSFDLYVNHQKIDSAHDATFSHGEIALFAGADSNPTEVIFRNAKVWT